MKYLFILLLLLSVSYCQQPILFKNINILKFNQNQLTTPRRTQPVQQLKFVGGSGWRHENEIEYGECINLNYGKNRLNPRWQCELYVPANTYVGSTYVVCEGYDFQDDPYITSGSCYLEYSLLDKNIIIEHHILITVICMYLIIVLMMYICICTIRKGTLSFSFY